MILSHEVKKEIIFLNQRGFDNQFISESLGVSIPRINWVLDRIYNDKNQIFVIQSLDDKNVYYVFHGIKENKLEFNSDGIIINGWLFDGRTKQALNTLYGFRIELYD